MKQFSEGGVALIWLTVCICVPAEVKYIATAENQRTTYNGIKVEGDHKNLQLAKKVTIGKKSTIFVLSL